MNENDLKFADYYIDCLLKAEGKAISPSYNKYNNAYNIIQRLKRKGIVERDGSNFIISELYFDKIENAGSYSEWLRLENSNFNIPIIKNINAEPTPTPIIKPDHQKSLLVIVSSNFWFRSISLLIFATIVEEIKFGIIWKSICNIFN